MEIYGFLQIVNIDLPNGAAYSHFRLLWHGAVMLNSHALHFYSSMVTTAGLFIQSIVVALVGYIFLFRRALLLP